jgi:hypothetical protein
MVLHSTRRLTKPVPAVLRMRTVHMRLAMDEGVPMDTGTGKRADPMVGWLSVTCNVVALRSTTKDPGVMPEPATDDPVKMLRVELTTIMLELMAKVAVVRVKHGTLVGHIWGTASVLNVGAQVTPSEPTGGRTCLQRRGHVLTRAVLPLQPPGTRTQGVGQRMGTLRRHVTPTEAVARETRTMPSVQRVTAGEEPLHTPRMRRKRKGHVSV